MGWVAAIPALASAAQAATSNSNQGSFPGASGTVPPPAPPTSANPNNTRNNINIAPVAVNLGEILGPYIQGGAENGGSGVDVPSPMARGGAAYAPTYQRTLSNNAIAQTQPYVTNTGIQDTTGSPASPVMLIGLGIAAVVLVAVVYKASRG